jgi:hypothetical protein
MKSGSLVQRPSLFRPRCLYGKQKATSPLQNHFPNVPLGLVFFKNEEGNNKVAGLSGQTKMPPANDFVALTQLTLTIKNPLHDKYKRSLL